MTQAVTPSNINLLIIIQIVVANILKPKFIYNFIQIIMKTIIFKIITRKRIDIDMIPFEISKKYPMHSHLLYEATEKLIVYNFEPSSKLNSQNITNYINYLKYKLKLKYNAYSVIVGEMQQQLKSPQ